jgi:fatty acid desaturase
MKMMPYTVMAGLVIAAIAFAIFGGGSYWVLPAIMVPAVLVYALVDRRLKARETRGERLAAEPNAR